MTLYSKSLEAHMRAYLKNVKLQDLNNQYQKAQHDIIRKSELMGLSQAETNNKLEELQNSLREQSGTAELVKQAKGAKLIPLSKTNAPEVVIQKEESKPMTASEYENILIKKKLHKGEISKTSKEINELAKMGQEDLLPIIKELKDYRAQRKQFEEDIINAKNNISQLKLRANLKNLKLREEKKMEFLNTKIMKSEDLLNSIQNRLSNLRPSERNTYKEPISKFKKELTEAIRLRNIELPLMVKTKELTPSEVSTVASTLPSPSVSPIANTLGRPGNWQVKKTEISKKLQNYYIENNVPTNERLNINKFTTQNDIKAHDTALKNKYGTWV